MTPLKFLSACMLAAIALCGISPGASWAQGSETVIHAFSWDSDGGFPWPGVAPDGKGNFFGTAYFGGAIPGSICCGTAYELSPNQQGGWNYQIIHTFTGPDFDGEAPSAGLIADSAGNLYGTTQEGASVVGCGSVYELSPTKSGKWKETILHRFNKKFPINGDGCSPTSWLVFDQAGNLYGTTEYGGGNNFNGECAQDSGSCGTVFKLSPQGNGKWKETIIHRFPEGKTDGLLPLGGLVFDHAGNLWGTTEGATSGSPAAPGTVYELSPGANGKWKETSLFQFTGDTTGYMPLNGLATDSAGNLYGTTFLGGSSGDGLVFELTPQPKGPPIETVLYEFQGCNATACPDGLEPWGGLTFDSAGNLYGTTTYGGAAGTGCIVQKVNIGCGTIFELSPANNGSWNYSIVYKFGGGTPGAFPTDDRMYVASDGTIFGTTFEGGDQSADCPQAVLGLSGCGTVFTISQQKPAVQHNTALK